MELSRKFVSESVVRHTMRQQARRDQELAELHGTGGGPWPGSTSEKKPELEDGNVSGVIAILDISGFTVLCEKASTDDTLMEELCRVINLAFSKEIEVVEMYGGEVLCFLGDGSAARSPSAPRASRRPRRFRRAGLLVFWPDLGEPGPGAADPWAVHRKASAVSSGPGAQPSEASSAQASAELDPETSTLSPAAAAGGRMAARAARAVQCALHVQEVFSEACVGMGANMKLRVAVAAGEFREYFCGIGGATSGEAGRVESALMDEEGRVVPGRMVHFLTGPAIEEAGEALSAIKTGEVAVCASAQRLLPAAVFANPLAARTRGSASADAHVHAPLPSTMAETAAETMADPQTPAWLQEGLHSADAKADTLPLRLPPLEPLLGRVVAQPIARVVGLVGSALSTLGGSGTCTAPAPPLSSPPAPHVVAPPAARRLLDAFVTSLPAGSAALPASMQLGPEEQDALALYVPYSVRARFTDMREWAALSGQRQFDPTRFLSEFRVVSVVFMKLEGLDPSQASVQRAVNKLQAVLYSYEGSLRQIVLDDKGMVMIGVFGLWPFAHEDDPSRAVACAVDMQVSMRAMGVNTHVGITTGLVFCTFVGSSSRCEFSAFGTVVNRAARLMSKSEGSVYADQRTYAGCRGQLKMEHVGDFKLKGIDDKVSVFRPVLRGPEGLRNASSRGRLSLDSASGAGGRIAFVAREAETARVEALVASAASRPEGAPGHETERPRPEHAQEPDGAGGAPPPPFLLYEGPSGSGKSTLCGYARRVAEGLGMTIVSSAGRSNRSRQPWFLWRAVVRQLFPLGSLDMGPLLDDGDFKLLPALAHALQLDAAAGNGHDGAADFGAKQGLRRGSAVARARMAPPESQPPSARAPKRRVRRRKSIHWITTESLTEMGGAGGPHAVHVASQPSSPRPRESLRYSLFVVPPPLHPQRPGESPPWPLPPAAAAAAAPSAGPSRRGSGSAKAAPPAPFAPPPRPSGPLVNGNRRGSILAPDISSPAPAAHDSNVRRPSMAPYARRSAAVPPQARRYSTAASVRSHEDSDDEAPAAVGEPVELIPLARFLAIPWVPSPEGGAPPTARRRQLSLSCDPPSGDVDEKAMAVYEISKKLKEATIGVGASSQPATAAPSVIAERRRRGSGVTMTDGGGAQTARGFVARTRKGSVRTIHSCARTFVVISFAPSAFFHPTGARCPMDGNSPKTAFV